MSGYFYKAHIVISLSSFLLAQLIAYNNALKISEIDPQRQLVTKLKVAGRLYNNLFVDLIGTLNEL